MVRFQRLTESLSFRLPLLVVAVALPAVILTVWGHVGQRSDAAESARAQALQVARSVSSKYEDAVESARQLTGPIAGIFGLAESLEGIDRETCVSFFSRFVGEQVGAPFIGVAGPDGQLICSSQGDPTGHSIEEFGFFQQALLTDVPTVSRFRHNSITGQDVISVGRMVRNAAGDVTGVVYVDIPAESLTPVAAVEDLPPGSFANIIDREGTIVARYPNGERVVGTSLAGGATFERVATYGVGHFETTSADGVSSLVSFTRVYAEDGYEPIAYAIAGHPTADLYSAANSALLRNLLVLAAVTLAALILGRLAAQPWIFGPINRLSGASNRLAAGDLAARVGPDYPPGELGHLSAAFDTMADRVQVREQEILDLNATLEERVEARTQQLEAANQELEAFSYSVSHDLRAPIRAIDGFSRILIAEHAEELAPEARRFLDLIKRSSVTMTSLIDDLLHFSRIGRASMTRRSTTMDGVVQDAMDDVRPEIGSRTIDFKIGDLGPARVDPALIRRVYANLLSNAVKFTRNVEAPRVEVGKDEQDGQVVYYVKDNGAGFDMKYADKLFGVFQRLHHADEFEGTGVGLATAQRVVLRHGGRIWANAALDKGAAFYFTIGDEENEEGETNGR